MKTLTFLLIAVFNIILISHAGAKPNGSSEEEEPDYPDYVSPEIKHRGAVRNALGKDIREKLDDEEDDQSIEFYDVFVNILAAVQKNRLKKADAMEAAVEMVSHNYQRPFYGYLMIFRYILDCFGSNTSVQAKLNESLREVTEEEENNISEALAFSVTNLINCSPESARERAKNVVNTLLQTPRIQQDVAEYFGEADPTFSPANPSLVKYSKYV